MAKNTYNLLAELKGRSYSDLVDYALGECKFFLLVTSENNHQLSLEGMRVLDDLDTFLYKMEMKSEWPGTIIFGGEVQVYTYHFVEESARILKKSANGLYEWQKPGLPDDLCLLRADESPWLVTIGHEDDSYFELTSDEYDRLIKALPAFSSMTQINKE